MNLPEEQANIIRGKFATLTSEDELANLINDIYRIIFPTANPLLKSKSHFCVTGQILNSLAYSSDFALTRYKEFKIPKKKKGEYRLISAPSYILKTVQKCLNNIFYCLIEVSSVETFIHRSATGFLPKYNILNNASPHIGKRNIYNIDLKDFFNNISIEKIKNVISSPPFNLVKERGYLGDLIVSICCNNGGLPQGAPTSPLLSNLACYFLDIELQQLANKVGSNYTRYADDITFSSDDSIFTSTFKSNVRTIIESNGYFINKNKERLISSGRCQEVTGLVVNEKLNLKRKYIQDLDFWLKHWHKDGDTKKTEKLFLKKYAQNNIKKNRVSIENVLWGKIQFLGMVRGKNDEIYLRFCQRWKQGVKKRQSKETSKSIKSNIFNVSNLLYEIAPIKAFGTQDPVALVEAYTSALKEWNLPQIPTFGFDAKENRKLSRNWFSVVFKQHQIALINKLKVRYPDNWKEVLAQNLEIIREDGGSTVNLGNGLKQNGDVQRWTFVINRDFVKSILGREYPTDFPFVLHSIKGENGVTHNGKSVIDLTFEEIKQLGINGRITEQKQWDAFVKRYKETVALLNEGRKFSKVFDLEHEVYGFFTKNSPYTTTEYEDVGKEYVYNTYEYNGKNYIVYVIYPTDGFSESSIVYLLDEKNTPITDEQAEEAIRAEITANTNEVINYQGRQLISTRIDEGKKLFTSIPLKQKDFSDLAKVMASLKTNENSSGEEITVDGIYISVQGYKADGGLKFNAPKSLKGSKYEFSVSFVPINKKDDVKKTIYISIDKNTKDFQKDLLDKIKDQAVKQKDKTGDTIPGLFNFTKETKVELWESLTEMKTSGDDLATLPYLVARTHPVQYNVDRWILIPKTEEVKALPIPQVLPIAQVVKENINFTAENTGETLVLPVLEDLKSTETKEETIEQKVFNLLKNEQGVIFIDHFPYWGITDVKEFFTADKNNPPKTLQKALEAIETKPKAAKQFFNILIDTGAVDVKYASTKRPPSNK